MNRTRFVSSGIGLVLSAVGCSQAVVDSPEPGAAATAEVAVAEMALVGSYPMPEGGELEIIEAGPGEFFVGQRLQSDDPRATEDLAGTESLVELYRHLIGREAPAEVMAAEQRRLEFEASTGELLAHRVELEQAFAAAPFVEQEPEFAAREAWVAKEAPRDPWGFRAAHCFEDNGADTTSDHITYTACWTERTGTSTATDDDVRGVFTAARCYRDQVTLRLRYRPWWNWETQFSRTVYEGETYRALRSAAIDFDIESRVTGGTAGFHHSTVAGRVRQCYESLSNVACSYTGG